MRIYTFFLLLLINITTASAGDAAQLKFIGFSEAGTHLAFQQYGIMDGSGFAYAKTYFIDVIVNEYAEKPIETVETEESNIVDESQSLAKIRELNLKQAEETLKKLAIVTDNVGTLLVSHLFSDLGVKTDEVHFAMGTPLAGTAYKTYLINMVESGGKAECFDMGEPKKITMTLRNESEKTDKILQKDKIIPISRGCPLHYRIQDVYVYKGHKKSEAIKEKSSTESKKSEAIKEKLSTESKKSEAIEEKASTESKKSEAIKEKSLTESTEEVYYIAVFLNMFTPGFEGQDMRYLVVTGTLN